MTVSLTEEGFEISCIANKRSQIDYKKISKPNKWVLKRAARGTAKRARRPSKIDFVSLNSCLYDLSREPYLRFTRGLFYRDRCEKLSLAHHAMCEFGGSKLFP